MQPREPGVTVGMVVHGDPAGVRRCVPSALEQSWRGPRRLVIVDDGSPDETRVLLDELGRRHQAVEVVRNPRSRGPAHARNQVLERAGGDMVAWIAPDTVWQPHKLQAHLTALRDAAADGHGAVEHLSVSPVRLLGPRRGQDAVESPALSGDQVRALLDGSLSPALVSVVGPAGFLREIGGFDERLEAGHTRELLLRAVAHGGRLVGVGEPTPTCTRVLAGRPPGPAQLRADHRVERVHRDLYRRYGRSLLRECRRERLLRAAVLHRREGRRLRAVGPLAHARLLTLVTRLVRLPVAASLVRAVRAARGAAGARPVGPATAGPALPATSDGRRASPAATAVAGSARPSPDDPTGASHDDPTGASHDDPTDASPDPTDASPDDPADASPEDWLRREAALREDDDLPAAQTVLEQGLARHPGDVALRVRLTELLLLRRDWEGCVAAWRSLPGDDDRRLTPAAVNAAASAYRMLDDHEAALRVARLGVQRWPGRNQLRNELYRARSALLDWRTCLLASPPDPAGRVGGDPVGVVTTLGQLAGGSGPVVGRVDAATGAATRVSLLVNGEPVATTHTRPSDHDLGAGHSGAGFALDCRQLREYLGDGDVLSVECTVGPLRLGGLGDRAVVLTGYPSRTDALHERLRDGWVFTKFGKLRRGHSKRAKQEVIALLLEVADLVSQHTGAEVYPLYGNLLGAVREHDFIPHDVGGFDAGYVSRRRTPDEVRAEFLDVCRLLLRRGFHLTVNPWCAMVRRRSTDRRFLDLNFGWFTADGALQLSYGWRFSPATGPERLRASRDCPLAGHLVRIPGDAEAVLRQLYGPDWVVPDQGFKLDVPLQRDVDFLLTDAHLGRLRDGHPGRVSIEGALGPHGEIVTGGNT